MHKKLTDMRPVDDIVTQNTPGLKIWEENWGGMQCATTSLPRVLTSQRF